MPIIKTRDSVNRTARTIDKSAIVAGRMKEAYIRTKRKAIRDVETVNNSANEYAADVVSECTETVTIEAIHQINVQGKTGVSEAKNNLTKLKGQFIHKRNTGSLISQQQKKVSEATQVAVESTTRQVVNTKPTEKRNLKFTHNDINRYTDQMPVTSFHHRQIAVKPIVYSSTVNSTGKTAMNAAKDTIKTAQKSIKTAEVTAKTTIMTTRQTVKTAQQSAQTMAKIPRSMVGATRFALKAVAPSVKSVSQTTVTALKTAITGTKALIAAVAAGGWVAITVIVVICMVAMIVGSGFGIFFSTEDNNTSQTLKSAVQEINTEFLEQIEAVQVNIPHDEVEIFDTQPDWAEVLAVYAVMITTDSDNHQEAVTIDDAKKAILKDIFWQMNVISYNTETKKVMIASEVVMRTYLHISVEHKSAEEMSEYFNFDEKQRKQLTELFFDDMRNVWNNIVP